MAFLNRVLIRFSDIIFSFTGLVIFLPVMAIIAIAIKLDSKGKVIYSQLRVGKNDRDFTLYKFRSMVSDSRQDKPLTEGHGDPRITGVGRILRKYKLDELPQLYNVLTGDMSLVGPRPEVRKYTSLYTPEERNIILSVRPGITDTASIEYADEGEILSRSDDPENYYVKVIMPAKLRLNQFYIQNPTFLNYLGIIGKTALRLLGR